MKRWGKKARGKSQNPEKIRNRKSRGEEGIRDKRGGWEKKYDPMPFYPIQAAAEKKNKRGCRHKKRTKEGRR